MGGALPLWPPFAFPKESMPEPLSKPKFTVARLNETPKRSVPAAYGAENILFEPAEASSDADARVRLNASVPACRLPELLLLLFRLAWVAGEERLLRLHGFLAIRNLTRHEHLSPRVVHPESVTVCQQLLKIHR